MDELVPLEHIAIGLEAADWRDAIRAAAAPLLASNSILPAYVDAMIAVVERLGPYIVLSRGFALAHAEPGDAVLRTSASLVTLKHSVKFGSPKDPVKVVMCLACTSKDQHIRGLGRIATALMHDGTLIGLCQARTRKEAYQLING